MMVRHTSLSHWRKSITLVILLHVMISAYTYAQTKFNSTTLNHGYNAYFMSVLSTLVYEDEVDIKKNYHTLGLSYCNGLKSFHLVDQNNPNTVAHLSTDGHHIFLVIRGTDDVSDLIQDLKLVSTIKKDWKANDVHIHQGFSELSDSFIQSTQLYKTLKACGVHKKIYIGGHSLGGALANLMAVDLKLHQFKVKGIYTYGAPRVGDAAWVKYFKKHFTTMNFQWRHVHDLVATVPKGSRYRDLPYLTLGKAKTLKVTVENINPFDGKGSFAYHNKKNYTFDLWYTFSLFKTVVDELSPLSLLNTKKLSAYCSVHRHCPTHQYCSTTLKNQCKDKKKNGSFCIRNVVCLSGNCSIGTCKAIDD